MRLVGPRHGYGVLVVFKTVRRFILNVGIRVFLLHADSKTAALNHEARNHAVKHRACIVAFGNIAQKVGNGFGCFGRVQFQRDNAVARDVKFDLWIAYGVFLKRLVEKGCRLDDDRRFWHIGGERAARACGRHLDFIDHVHATGHPAEHGIPKKL